VTSISGIAASRPLRLIAFVVLVLGLFWRTLGILSNPERPLQTCDGRAYHALAVAL